MPSKPPKPCNQHGCGALTHERYCHDHKRQVQQKQDQQRGTAHQRGYTSKWRKVSKAYLAKHPLCECDECQAGKLRLRQATVVDHIIPHKGDMTLFWDRSNWMAMAKQCHDKKTAREDGGFGRAAVGRAG